MGASKINIAASQQHYMQRASDRDTY